MILHLVDDEKIIDRIITIFEEVLPEKNHFICFVKDKASLVSPNSIVEYYKIGSKYDGNLDIYTKVIFHFLSYDKIIFFNQYIKKSVICYWILWGADLYNSLLMRRGYQLYSPENFFIKKSSIKQKTACSLYKLGIYPKIDKDVVSFIQKNIDFFLADCEDEYWLLNKYLKVSSRTKYCHFFYYPIDEILGEDLLAKRVHGNNIIIGNSASYTNNHQYVLKILEQINLKGKKLILPVSYGGNNIYKRVVLDLSNKLFEEKVIALVDFLPIKEYNNLLLSAEICIYGSWRQEAFGNILIALYLGAKVFISHHNPLFNWFKKIGIYVYELEKISNEDIQIEFPLEIQSRNREILIERYNRKRLMNIINDIFQA